MAAPAAIAVALFVWMAVAWATQRVARNAGWVDVFWTFGVGAACAAAALIPTDDGLEERRWLTAAMAVAWSARLGWHVAARVARSPEDRRYVALRQQWGTRFQPLMFGFLQLQALVSLPLAGAAWLAAHRPASEWGLADAVGPLILLAAVAGEGLADRQLDRYRADPDRAPVNDRGLWAWSRHPNYFFEWLGWWAYPAMAVQLTGWPQGWLALLAPATMYVVLRRMTGVPALEAHMRASRGPAWTAYAARTSVFLPAPPRKRTAAP